MPLTIRTLERSDVRSGFSCGEPSLDVLLERYAWQNQQRHHLGITYVAVDDTSRRVVGYFTAAMPAIAPEVSHGTIAPGGYSSVPALRIARLAVDHRAQGAGIGSELLYAALRLALDESDRSAPGRCQRRDGVGGVCASPTTPDAGSSPPSRATRSAPHVRQPTRPSATRARPSLRSPGRSFAS